MQYFVVMIDYGRRGREAIVDPEITRREVIARVASGEYKNISFIHEIADSAVDDITAEISGRGSASRNIDDRCRPAGQPFRSCPRSRKARAGVRKRSADRRCMIEQEAVPAMILVAERWP
jgi:hypothetical protein